MSIDVRVRRITYRAEGIHSFELTPVQGDLLPTFTAGAHVHIHLPNGLSRPYSIHSCPTERSTYELAVQREASGRGGSRYLHENVRAGDILSISPPVNNFELDERASHHVLIGGGIGVTPLISMARRLRAIGARYAFHYCSRTEDLVAFREEAEKLCGESLSLHIDGGDPTKGLDCAGVLAKVEPGTHVYCCGPAGLLKAVRAATSGWPAETVHFENFGPASSTDSTTSNGCVVDFEVELASTGQVVAIRSDQSIVEALRHCGLHPETSCEAGTCGACRTRLLEGEAEHLDYVLTDDEQNDWIMICVSRAKSRRLKLGL